jgi:hypothetical protein
MSNPIRVNSLFEACQKAKEDGATCYSRMLVKSLPWGKDLNLYEVDFFASREVNEKGNLTEVSHWLIGIGAYQKMARPFSTSLIRNECEGHQPIEDIVL